MVTYIPFLTHIAKHIIISINITIKNEIPPQFIQKRTAMMVLLEISNTLHIMALITYGILNPVRPTSKFLHFPSFSSSNNSLSSPATLEAKDQRLAQIDIITTTDTDSIVLLPTDCNINPKDNTI